MKFDFICTPLMLLLLVVSTACALPMATPQAGNTSSTVVASGETRLLHHAMGETVVPAHPQRVVVLDSGELDAALTLGVKPVGAFTLFEGDDFLSYLHDQMAGVQAVGTINQPNLEAIAALEPDLILSNKTRHEAIYDQLSAIAPTVFAEAVGYTWQQNFLLYAQALGKEAEAEAVVAAYQARLAEFKARMGDRLNTQVSVIRVVEDGVRIIQRNMYIGVILADAGLARPPAQDVDDRFQLVSFEQIPQMDGDVIFVSSYGQDDSAYQQLLAQPLWQANAAVAAGQAYGVNDDIWHVGLGYTAANLVIDDLWRYLLGEEPPAPASITVVEETPAYRLIRHAAGETQIPANPHCVVVAGSGYLDHLLALGVKPCGAAHGPGGSGFPELLADQLADVEYVGGTLEVNLERVALTNPDLIIAMYPEHVAGEFAADFTPIAPTVYLTEPWQDWRQALVEIGLILGKRAEAEARLAEFDAQLAEAQAQLEAAIGDEKVIFLRVLPTEIRPYGTASPTGDILFNGLGLTPAVGVPIGEHAQSISLELIPQIDADHLFLLDQTEDQMAAIKANPLWQQIPAVQQGNIYPVDVKIWIQGEGLLAYTQLVEDVLSALAGEGQ